MIFKDSAAKTDQPIEDAAAKNNVLSQLANPAEKVEKSAAPAVRKAKGVQSRFEDGGYIIESVARPANRRRRALIAILLLLFFLTGSVFYYGGNTYGAQNPKAVPGSYESLRKTKASLAPVERGSEEKPVAVSLKATSIEKDMNVRILGEDGYPVLGHRFEI
ncbi:MAG: hypothetical protein FWE66_02195, partial [Oscillospiraceae bacterium]|nr:hypothetical protein [Oscillospiraceae bacterium]